MGRKAKEGGDAVEKATDTVAAGAIEGAGAALKAGGDSRDVAAAAIGGAAAGEALAVAGDESGGPVDNGENPGENGGKEMGADSAEEGDHITAFERRCERLSAIAEEAEFESGSIVGDLRDLILDINKAQPKGWGGMSEGERREFARTCEKVAKTVLRKVVIVIAEEDEISVHATLAGYRVNGDAFELKAKAKGDEETAVQLFRLDGHEVVIISADSTRFHGQRRAANIPTDKPELPFADSPAKGAAAPGEIASDPPPEHPADDSDLAGEEREEEAKEVVGPLDKLGEGERVNLKTGMVERHPGGGADDDNANWIDVREALFDELAAERERIADFDED